MIYINNLYKFAFVFKLFSIKLNQNEKTLHYNYPDYYRIQND